MAQAAENSVTEAAVKYFFFICFDEQLSFSASLRVLAELKSHNRLDNDHRAYWVRTLHNFKPKLKTLRPRPWTQSPAEQGILLPDDFDFTTWVSFVNIADANEVEAVLLSRVLGFSDREIGEGLGLTTGTVRYRVGHGLRHLGGYVES